MLFLQHIKGTEWECLLKPAKRLKAGDFVIIAGKYNVRIVEKNEEGICTVDVGCSVEEWYATLEKIGKMPLPPYITAPIQNNSEYQTSYAKIVGSAAAPTAGLHFTDEVFKKLTENNIAGEYVTLHVGLDTFQPVRVENIKEHKMHTEFYTIPSETSERLLIDKKKNKRIVAVGTTTVRVLESFGSSNCTKQNGNTDIFIYPGYEYTFVDAMITNFHLPKSTLIMMISAFAGKELIFKAYEEAMKQNYRFYSFGDAMLIV